MVQAKSRREDSVLIMRQGQSGMAIGYLLGIIMLAIMIVAFMARPEDSGTAAEMLRINNSIVSQSGVVAQAITACADAHPAGNNTTMVLPPPTVALAAPATRHYPRGDVWPADWTVATSFTALRGLRCPGITLAPPATAAEISVAQNIWTGIEGHFMPTQINGFLPWQYVNDQFGVRIRIVRDVAVADDNFTQLFARAARRIGMDESSLSVAPFTATSLKNGRSYPILARSATPDCPVDISLADQPDSDGVLIWLKRVSVPACPF